MSAKQIQDDYAALPKKNLASVGRLLGEAGEPFDLELNAMLHDTRQHVGDVPEFALWMAESLAWARFALRDVDFFDAAAGFIATGDPELLDEATSYPDRFGEDRLRDALAAFGRWFDEMRAPLSDIPADPLRWKALQERSLRVAEKLTVGQDGKKQTIRSLHKFDFDVDRSQPGTTRVRYAFTESRDDSSNSVDWFLQVGETVRTDGAGGPVVGSCRTPAGWSTRDEATQGQTIQPLIRRTSRNAAGVLPATVEWWASGITNGNTFDPAEAQARVLAFPVVGSAFGTPRDLSVLTNYPVCSTQIRGYWGDYFGLLGFLGASGGVRHVAAITDSRGAACTRGLAEASPTHIKAVLWGSSTP